MKASHVILLFYLLVSVFGAGVCAQTKSMKEMKYGKVNKKDFSSYTPSDTAVAAVFLKKKGITYYNLGMRGNITVESEYEFRLQVLRPEGTEYANVSIPFFRDQRPGYVTERIYGIDAVAYNLVDGKVEETDLERKYIVEEKVSDNVYVMKFSIPNVKPGSIIEYKYKFSSNNPFSLDAWKIQEDIPVLRVQYDLHVPEIFKFNISSKGGRYIERKHSKGNSQMTVIGLGGITRDILTDCYTFTSENVPPLKEEPMVWCKENYRCMVDFEIRAIDIPLDVPAYFRTTWADVCEELKLIDNFGRHFGMRNPLREEQEKLHLDPSLPVAAKAMALRMMLMSYVQWDGKYSLFSDISARQCLEQKHGNNAMLNFIYLSMLKDAGIKATPVLIRQKTMGDLMGIRPSLENLSTFVVGIYDEKNKLMYTDCSIPWCSLNLLPPQLMANLGICFATEAEGTSYTSLADVGRHYQNILVQSEISPDGHLKGSFHATYYGCSAFEHLAWKEQQKDSLNYVQALDRKYEIKVDTFKSELKDGSYTDFMDYEKQLTTGDGVIYFNPFVVDKDIENPFLAEQRTMPIEFPYKYVKKFYGVYKLPEGYEPESLPQPIRLKVEKGGAAISCIVQQKEGSLMAMLDLKVDKTVFPANRNVELRQLWEQLINMSKLQIVLKKKAL